MSGTNATISRTKGTSSLVRPRFEPGMLLQHDDLELMSSYTRELNRLMFRSMFGIKPSTIRADLSDFLDAMTPGESGFSPEESRMLKSILGLRERRVSDVMVPRADIIAVQQDIQIGRHGPAQPAISYDHVVHGLLDDMGRDAPARGFDFG